MSRLDDIKKRLKNSNTGEEQGTSVEQSTGMSRLDKIKQQVNSQTSLTSTPTDLKDLYNEYSTLMNDAKTSSEKLGYNTATDLAVSFNDRYKAFNQKINEAQVKYNLNRQDLTEEERELNIYLNQLSQSAGKATGVFWDAFDYYKQWKTEDDYKAAVKQAEDYERLKTLDIEAEEREIEKLEAGEIAITSLEAGGREEYIAKKKTDLAQAKRIQKALELSGVADPNSKYYDPEFKYNTGYKEEVGAEDEFYRMANKKLLLFKHIKDEEVAIYNYYYAKFGREKAQEYLDSIEEQLKARKGAEMFEAVEGDWFLEQIIGAVAGIDNWVSGAINEFTDKDYYVPSAIQFASGMIVESNKDDWFGSLTYDFTNNLFNMLPSVLVGTVTGGIGGTLAMGVSAAGNAKAEMINLGYSKGQANAYGLMVGASEALLEKFLGGIAGVSDGGLVSKLGAKALGKIDNALARVAITHGGKLLDEAFEESLQTILEPWFESVVTGLDYDAPDIDEVLYSGLLGALTAGAFDIGGTVIGTGSIAENVALKNQGKALMEQGIDINKLAELGKDTNFVSADSVAYRLAGKVNEKTGAYTIARLFNEMNAQLTTQNQADIIRSLERKGVAPKNAKTMATALANVVAGVEITKTQEKLLESNPVLTKTVMDEILNENSTVRQRMTQFNESVFPKSIEATSETSQEATGENPTTVESAENKAENVSDDGKTKQISTGEEISIKEIASIKDGEITLRLDDGETVNAKDVEFGSKQEGLIYENVVDMNFNAATANAFVKGYDPSEGLTVEEYALGFREAYRYGEYSFPIQEMSREGFSAKLSEATKSLAYNLGKVDAKYKVSEKQKTVAEKKRTAPNNEKTKGKIHYEDGVLAKGLTERQSTSLKGLETIAEALGVEFHIFESEVENGKRKGENGWFDPKDGSIHIDLYAGLNGEGTILFTAAHELTHFIREWSPAKFKMFADFLLEQYGKKGISVDVLVKSQIEKAKRNGRDISYDTAYEEVIADSCEAMLADGDAISKIAKLKAKDKSLWQKIKDFVASLVVKIKKAYEGLKPDSIEGRYVSEMLDVAEQLKALWTEALVDADANYEAAENTLAENGIVVDSETDSGTLMSVRDVLDDTEREKVAKTLATRFDVTKEEALEWLKAETSLASLILNPKYSQYLDYTADANEESIKSNSDYPQGTVDFSNICKKRRDFTEIMNRILRSFPNHIFEPTDLAKIRTIMEQEGMEVAGAICYVEDRRQQDSVVAQDFINSLALYREGSKTRPDGKAFNANQLKALKLIDGSTYTPSIYELITLEGRNELKAKNPAMEEAWVKFNNARGMQSVRLLLNDAEYKRQILKYNKNTVKSKNNNGGLRIYSFSDMEMFHLIDIIQVITDSATVGLSIQGYTKVNEYAKAVKDTGEKLNRSLIPKGDLGYHMEKGKVVLDFDTVEGIDINHPDFFDSTDNPNVGNIVIGINPTQIRAAMMSKFIDYIIPFHTGQSKEVLGEKGIAEWVNYKDSQTEKDLATGRTSQHQINIYTEVIQAAEKAGKPITNKVEFVNKFLEVCKENNLIPRFAEFLNMDENGNYVYTEGYHKFLVDFKTFDSNTGEYLPQMPVKPIFDSNYLTKLLRDYVKTQKVKDAEFAEKSPKVIERITNEIIKPNDTKFSERDSWNNIKSIQGLESYSVDEVIDITKNHIQSVLAENGEYVEIIAVRPYGSRAKGTAKTDSDLDIVVQYEGDIREDDMFGMLNDEDSKLYIEGIEVDINPIKADDSGDIEDYFGRVYDFDKYNTKYSERDSLGNELSQEQQEFFKDSKVRDENGNLLVVYHGSPRKFTVFDSTKVTRGKHNINFFTPDRSYAEGVGFGRNGVIYTCYLNIKNPYYYSSEGQKIGDIDFDTAYFYGENKLYEALMNNGYDGIIVGDKYNPDEIVSFQPNQIKEITNQKPTSSADIRYSDRDALPNFDDIDAWFETLSAEELKELMGETNIDTIESLPTKRERRDAYVNKLYEQGNLNKIVSRLVKANPKMAEYFANTKMNNKYNPLFPSKTDEYIVMFHGTPGDFNIFDTSRVGKHGTAMGSGVYFTSSLSYAESYKEDGGRIIATLLNIEKPLSRNKLTITKDQFKTFVKQVVDPTGDDFLSNYGDVNSIGYDRLLNKVANELFEHNSNDADLIEDVYVTSRMDFDEFHNGLTETLGYDGVIAWNKAEGTQAIVFKSNQAKEIFNFNPTSDPDIRYSERDSDRYSYEALISKPDMRVTTISNSVPSNRADIVVKAKQNAASVGKTNKDGSVSVYVEDVDADVVLSKKGLVHSLDRRFEEIAPVTVQAGEILRNSIKINELIPSKEEADSSYVLIGVAQNSNGELYVVRFVVNKFSNELDTMEVLYAINAKKSTAVPNAPLVSTPNYRTTISIAQLLEFVNNHFPDILPEQVLRHFGYDARPEGKVGESALYQDRDTEGVSNRSLLANALESVAQNEIEKNKLKQYQSKIALIESEQAKLTEVKEEANKLRFTKGRTQAETKRMRELDAEATMIANRINTYDRQLLNLESTTALKNVLEREKKLAYKKAEQRGKEALATYKERAAQTQRELLTRYQESRKKAMENRKQSEIRTKIKAFKQKLESALQHPTDRQYVPLNLVQAMVDVCELIDTDTPLYKKDGSLNKAQERRNATKERLQALKDEYENLKTNADPMYSGEFDEVIYKYLHKLRIDFEGKSLSDMTLTELEEMYDILKSINDTLREARKLIGWGDASEVYAAGETIIAEQEEITKGRKKDKRSTAQKAKDSVIDLTLSPVRNVERMSGYRENSPLLRLFKDFERGVRKKNMFVMEAYKDFEALTTGKNAKLYDDAIYKEYEQEYTDVNGRKFKVSKMMMMQAVMSYEREISNNMHHIEGSGFSFADLSLLRKGKLKEAISEEHSHRMTIGTDIVQTFKDALADDKWAQDYMAMAHRFFDEKAKDAVNETYITLKHRVIARDKNYIPFEVDKNFVVREISAENDIQQTINSYGMLKETKDNATQPLIVTGLNNILDRHIEQVGNVYGLAVAIRNFNKVWNVRAIDSGFGGDPTVQAAIERNWGLGGKKFITQTVQDLQGARPNNQSWLYRKAKSGYIGATFLLNLSVVFKQIGSLFSSTSMLRYRDPIRMIGNLVYTMANHKKISAEVDKYTATVWMRRQGLSDAELSTLATEAKKPGLLKVLNKLPAVINPTKWIQGMDSMVALSLWKYAKQDTAKRTGLKGEELLKATAEFFDSVIENTQSMSDVLHRPEIQKRSDVVSEAFGMFKTDLYQMAGQLHVALGRYTHNKSKENKAALARTAYSSVRSAVWGSLMTSLFALLRYKVDPYRDDEDDELTAGSWLLRQLTGLAGDVSGYIFPLAGSEIVGLFENIMYGEEDEVVDSLALTAINDLYSTIVMVANSIKEGELPSADDWKKLVVKGLQVFGVPANNLDRIVNAIRLHAEDIANGEFFSFEAGLDSPNAQRLYNAILSGDEETIEKAKRKYEDDDAIEQAIKNALRENDPRIQEAVIAHFERDSVKRASIVSEIMAEGYFSQDVVQSAVNSEAKSFNTDIQNAIKAKDNGEESEYNKIIDKLLEKYPEDFVERMLDETIVEEEEETEDKAISFYTTDDYYNSIIDGDTYALERIKEDIINTAVANGKSREDAEQSFYSSFRTKVRNGYADGTINRAKAMEMLISYGGMDSDDAYWQMKQYDYYAQNGTTDGYSKYGDFHNAVKTGVNLKSVIQDYTSHGVEKQTLASQITSYFKPLYINMTNSERASIKGYLLNAYAQLGYNRYEKSKDIDKWLK